MTPRLAPATAQRRFVRVTFLFWFPIGLYIPSQVLLLTERGMGLEAVGALFAVHSFTVAALELPTGGLSDVLGRRGVLAAAGALLAGALTLLALGTGFSTFVAAMLLAGTARALASGPAEAWYVDTVQAHVSSDAGAGDLASELRVGLARGSTALALALAAGTSCGGAVPWLLGLGPDLGTRLVDLTGGAVIPLAVPMLLGAVVQVVYLLHVAFALPEPPRAPVTFGEVLRGVPVTVRRGLRLGVGDALVRRLLLSAGAAGAALVTVELLTPGRAAAVAGTPASGALLFAGLACAGFASTAAGSALAPRIAGMLGGSEVRAVRAGILTSAAGLLLLGATASWGGWTSPALAAVGYGLMYVGIGASGPNKNALLHRRVDSAGRATALSFQSLSLQGAGALAGPGAAELPRGPLPWVLAAGLLLVAAGLWTGRRVPVPPARPAPGSRDVSGRPTPR
ncbi:MFS transporter [Streptomyces sp. DSM 42041]|uniref:MFS transporter n=1 Tax=Streptomyces hazeniae TaxID=3075538 RepID=A0ABU2NVU0_9ACTN|nr:MFS transporter [Streptomyces sp. DSM 42041]MDT0381105.1 MFS transporter [Streptomyces sp. DSM 42041]